MTGEICVRRISKSGNYKSTIDFDKSFIDKNNPMGFFKMIVQPIRNNNGENEIRYMKTKNGIIVSGEAYIISGSDEKDIDEKCRRYTSDRWENLLQREVFSSSDLW